MGFHIDMAELIKLRDAYEKDSTATVESLGLAKSGMNGIITSNAMYGEVGKAINDEINNSHNAIIVGLKDAYEVTSGEFSQTLSELQEAIGESNESAILDEAVMTQAGTDIDTAGKRHGELETDISSIYSDISDLVAVSSPKSSVASDLSTAKKVLTDAIDKVNTFDGSGQEPQAKSLLSGLDTWIEMGNQVQGLSYTDPVFTEFAGYSVLADAVATIDSDIEQNKEKLKQLKEQALKEAKEKAEKEQ